MKGLAALGLILALGWWGGRWWGDRWWGDRHTGFPAQRAQSHGAPMLSVGRTTPPATEVTDPALAPPIPPGVRVSVTQTAADFARDLLSAPPGGSSAATRCAALITPAFEAWLADTPGAPVLAGAAAPVVVTGVVATVDDWAPGSVSVALGLSLHAGTNGPPSFLAMDVHLVDVAGHWLVTGMEL